MLVHTKQIMRIPFRFLLFVLVFLSCEDNDELNCKVEMAKSGYINGNNLTYYFEYHYTYEGNKLTKFESISLDNQNISSTTEFEYDSKGRVIREYDPTGVAPKYKDYEYVGNFVKIKEYAIFGSDTTHFSETQFLYIENPKDKVYHDTFNKTSLKFKNGNVVEYGYYEVSAADTIDSFYEHYSYDSHDNYFRYPEYRIAIPSDFMWAKVTSKNNLVRAQYIAGGWDFSYTYSYDDNNRLRRHYGKSGITVDFEDSCN
jgi:hypothetical protein